MKVERKNKQINRLNEANKLLCAKVISSNQKGREIKANKSSKRGQMYDEAWKWTLCKLMHITFLNLLVSTYLT